MSAGPILEFAYHEYVQGGPEPAPLAQRPRVEGPHARQANLLPPSPRGRHRLALILLALVSRRGPRFASVTNVTNILTQISINP